MEQEIILRPALSIKESEFLMHLLQHILLSYVDELNDSPTKIDLKEYKKSIPYTILPDAIRFYTGERRFSHFEISQEDLLTDNNAFNGMLFPEDLKNIGKIKLISAHSVSKECIGGRTSIEHYEELNKHLPPLVFSEIREHLEQDNWYDVWVRKNFDCSNSVNDKFKVKRIEIDRQEFREMISILEADSLCRLFALIKHDFNVKINKQWIEEIIFDTLSAVYNDELFNNTIKFINIDNIKEEREKTLTNIPNSTLEQYCEMQFNSVVKYINTSSPKMPRHHSNWG